MVTELPTEKRRFIVRLAAEAEKREQPTTVSLLLNRYVRTVTEPEDLLKKSATYVMVLVHKWPTNH